ncbi:MAG: N-acetylmuramoyl-L-alanine amidase, partial [Gammaproteobacteria bacterium]|nr:N-acetylmuramoyl-L-alanine amidase [Gammaproteobacteria bacterium]
PTPMTRPTPLPPLALLLAALFLHGCGGGPSPSNTARAPAAVIHDIRMWHAPHRSRIVFDMNRRAAFSAFNLDDPARVVVDLRGVRLARALPGAGEGGQFIRRMRAGAQPGGVTRLVFDLKRPARYAIQQLPPADRYRHRLVVDFYPVGRAPRPQPAPPRAPGDELLVLIDPGHGGEDPGAVGKRTYEKHVVLQIAKRLKSRLDRRPGLRAELTRSGDYYIPLRGRTRLARRRHADLFVSIHADGFTDPRARGASVYALSQRGASSETAKRLANKENASDLIGGVSLLDKDNQLAGVLLDMSMTETVNQSLEFGREVLDELKKIGRVHSARVEQAGFVVLKSPDIPSILVETAFITNPGEEQLLMNKRHQNRIADAITVGIARHIAKHPNRYANR